METKTSRKVTNMILAGACAAALAVGSAVPALAAEVDGRTNVSYNTLNIVPGTATWGVQIPSGIVFTADQSKGEQADVKLVEIDPGTGAITPGTGLDNSVLPGSSGGTGGKVDVSVQSANAMKLTLTGGTDPVPYQVVYRGSLLAGPVTVNDGAKTVIASLDETNDTATGVAHRLGAGASDGAHTDVLTYSYDNGVTA